MGTPQIGQVSIVTSDMEASIAFYERLGLTFEIHPDWRAHHVSARMANGVALDLDSAQMTRAYDPAWQGAAGGGNSVVIFNVDSADEVDRLHGALTAAGAPNHQEPFDAFWGARYAVVDDPDGNHVGIMGPVDPAHGGPPPAL